MSKRHFHNWRIFFHKRLCNKSAISGFSTLEMLIAMTVIIFSLSAVTLTSFGSQLFVTDSETSVEALSMAQELLEQSQTLARKDFHLVNPTSTLLTLGSITYVRSLHVSTTSFPDYATKKITATVSWDGGSAHANSVALSALVTNFSAVIGGDTCDSVRDGDWLNPLKINTITDFSQLVGTSSSVQDITAIDAYKGKLYVVNETTQYKTDPDFFVFDIEKIKTDPLVSLIGKVDHAPTLMSGLTALHVAEGGGGMYAYLTNGYESNWNTCSVGPNCAQLVISDVTHPETLNITSLSYYKIPGVLGVSGSGGSGKSIFYKDGLLYVGLTSTSGGAEFHIIDVHDPLHPVHIGAYNVDATIKDIQVVGKRAYLSTTDNDREIIVLDVTQPTSPKFIAKHNASGALGFGYGNTHYVQGDTLYAGRTYVGNAPEFLAIDTSTTTTIESVPIATSDVGQVANPFTVNGVYVRDMVAFLLGGSPSSLGKLLFLNLKNTPSVSEFTGAYLLPGGSVGTALDCEGNYLFVGSVDGSQYGYLSVITSSP